MDWASFAANKLMACGAKNEADGIQKIAAALRKAKADGVRDGARLSALRFGQNILLARAVEIEKGQE